jgi:hypothetical protein
MKGEIYVSTDVETDGPCPGINSLLSFSSVALFPDGRIHGHYVVNLRELPEGKQDPDTMVFWAQHPEAWQACRTNQREPSYAMPDYAQWVEGLPGKPVFVAFPAGFDFTWIYWYLYRFAGRNPFGWSAIDMKTLAMCALKKRQGYRKATKKSWPKLWFPANMPHTHVAHDDAMEQGYSFIRMMEAMEAVHDKAWRYEELN